MSADGRWDLTRRLKGYCPNVEAVQQIRALGCLARISKGKPTVMSVVLIDFPGVRS